VLHICGNTTHLIPGMARTGAQGASLDSPVDFAAAAQKIPPDLVLIGNVDPVGVMLEGNPEKVKDAAASLLKKMAGKRNFILSSGCDLPRDTPHENIDALIKAAKTFSF
jgi:uroporphyrinogen decarboxylase